MVAKELRVAKLLKVYAQVPQVVDSSKRFEENH